MKLPISILTLGVLSFAAASHAATSVPDTVLNVTVTGSALTEAAALPTGTKIVPVPISNKSIAAAFSVNTGKTPDYALVFDATTRKVLLRGISTAAAKPDIEVLDLSGAATETLTNSKLGIHTLLIPVAAGAGATGTVGKAFQGLNGTAIETLTDAKLVPATSVPKATFAIVSTGKNELAGAPTTDAIFTLKLTTGAKFVQKP